MFISMKNLILIFLAFYFYFKFIKKPSEKFTGHEHAMPYDDFFESSISANPPPRPSPPFPHLTNNIRSPPGGIDGVQNLNSRIFTDEQSIFDDNPDDSDLAEFICNRAKVTCEDRDSLTPASQEECDRQLAYCSYSELDGELATYAPSS